ncbi:hypothetical protein [Mycolicibacter hiberniae]|uniref:Uncharacterized protein n=1 Tax=Mycolicibacter hiberniae TaxID=29314 RepID=A0A7I7WYK2_9MYCO|nr:hypothetical protein [Mycolicibacter hiberniae]MCV7086645.1 hypothetical protein [Mycolicibacter hiberniae]BBZ22230.1 hypothetical protein MHIB_06480 [Mycolicibacter hiberniae]
MTQVDIAGLLPQCADGEPDKHGRPEARHYNFEPTFIMWGLQDLHLEFDPVG